MTVHVLLDAVEPSAAPWPHRPCACAADLPGARRVTAALFGHFNSGKSTLLEHAGRLVARPDQRPSETARGSTSVRARACPLGVLRRDSSAQDIATSTPGPLWPPVLSLYDGTGERRDPGSGAGRRGSTSSALPGRNRAAGAHPDRYGTDIKVRRSLQAPRGEAGATRAADADPGRPPRRAPVRGGAGLSLSFSMLLSTPEMASLRDLVARRMAAPL